MSTVGSLETKGRTAVVTGSSSGNGRAISIELAKRGFNVACADIRELPRPEGFEEDLQTTTCDEIAKLGCESFFQSCDVSRPDNVSELIAEAVKRFGRVDVMVNNAGIFTEYHTIVDETEAQYDFTMNVNAKGVWAGCKYAIAQMLQQDPIGTRGGARGKVINIASIGGLIGLAAEPAYCASKGAVVNLTRQLAVDFGKDRINVNAICPGILVTAMVREWVEDKAMSEKLHELTPWPTFGSPDDLARLVAFLASDDSDWITGSIITLDGGFTCR